MNVFRLALLAAFAPASLAGAQPQPTNSVSEPPHELQQVEVPTASAPAHTLDSADVTAFFDGLVPMQLERSDIAGATVLVVQNGQVLLAKGYGYTNWKTKKPVDPTTSIFRLASISKLFTWISIMQLEEQGKVDLDADVNRYLDFKIRPAFDKPITLRNLMTHTPGFEDVWRDNLVSDPEKSPSLRDFLIKNQPKRIYPPGVVAAYSNYGGGLACYIVQRISGEPFEQYVQEHIFTPLGMTHSSFYQPLPSRLELERSEGYHNNTEAPSLGFEFYSPVGAGALSSTAADIGRFGQALLNGGELDGQRILRPDTIAAMWTPQFSTSDRLPALCLGFYQMRYNHLTWVGHEGDLIAFHSLFAVEPTHKLVLFVSYNSAGEKEKVRAEVLSMFTDRYFPAETNRKFINVSSQEAKSIEGYYLETDRPDSTRSAILNPTQNGHHATVNEDGTLSVSGMEDLRGHSIHWKPVDKDLWQQEGGQKHLFVIRDGASRVLRLAYDAPYMQYERMPWYEDSAFVFAAIKICLGVMAMVMLAPIIRLVQRVCFRKRLRPAPQPGTQWLPWNTQLLAWLWSILFSVVIGFVYLCPDLTLMRSDWEREFWLVNAATALALVLSLVAVISSPLIWRRTELRRITKLKFSLVALSSLVLSWFAVHYHFIGSVTRY